MNRTKLKNSRLHDTIVDEGAEISLFQESQGQQYTNWPMVAGNLSLGSLLDLDFLEIDILIFWLCHLVFNT